MMKTGESVCVVQADQRAAIDTIGVLCIVLKTLKLDMLSSFRGIRRSMGIFLYSTCGMYSCAALACLRAACVSY